MIILAVIMGSGTCFVNLIPALVVRVNMETYWGLEACETNQQIQSLAIFIILRMVHLQMFENMLLIFVLLNFFDPAG